MKVVNKILMFSALIVKSFQMVTKFYPVTFIGVLVGQAYANKNLNRNSSEPTMVKRFSLKEHYA